MAACHAVVGGLESYLMQRVDAARGLARTPARAAEANGRLFVAKRCHEALKAGRDVGAALEGVLAEVEASLPERAHDGAQREAQALRRRLDGM